MYKIKEKKDKIIIFFFLIHTLIHTLFLYQEDLKIK